jgi:hypothetical protein
VLKRDAAQKALDDADAEVKRLQEELAKLPEGERENSEIKKQLDAATKTSTEKKTARDAAVKVADDAQKADETQRTVLAGLDMQLFNANAAVTAAKQAESTA